MRIVGRSSGDYCRIALQDNTLWKDTQARAAIDRFPLPRYRLSLGQVNFPQPSAEGFDPDGSLASLVLAPLVRDAAGIVQRLRFRVQFGTEPPRIGKRTRGPLRSSSPTVH